MNIGDDMISFMRRQEIAFLATLADGPRIVERGMFGPWGEDSIAEHCLHTGFVARMRSHPRCGQDDDPPFFYMLTEKGRERLAQGEAVPEARYGRRRDVSRHPLAPTPKDSATRCDRSGLRYFEQPEIDRRKDAREIEPCPGCGKAVRLRETRWGIALIPRHRRAVDRRASAAAAKPRGPQGASIPTEPERSQP